MSELTKKLEEARKGDKLLICLEHNGVTMYEFEDTGDFVVQVEREPNTKLNYHSDVISAVQDWLAYASESGLNW